MGTRKRCQCTQAASADADAMFESALEAGAEDVTSDENGHEIFCAADDLSAVADALEARFGEPKSARLVWRPRSMVEIDEKAATSLFALLEALDDNDDAQQVAANFDVPDEVLERLNA
jgi:transcriptional/translational regulatory protein YebC/TACO1